jgi:hypothetical protein
VRPGRTRPSPARLPARSGSPEATEDREGEAEEADADPAGDVDTGACDGSWGYDGTRSFPAPAPAPGPGPGPGESVEPGRPCARPGPCVAPGLCVEPRSYAGPLSYADTPPYADTAAASAETPPNGSTATSSPAPRPTPHSPRRHGVTPLTSFRCSVATK